MSNIIRVEKNANYVVMNRTALNDTRLSWKAKGIIAYMLSMPDDWKFYMSELVKHSTDGERAFRAGFKELQDFGYVVRKPIREGQRIKEWETVVYEVPINDSLLCGSVHVENEDVQNVHVQNEDVQNSRLLSTDSNQVLNKPNTDNNQVLTSSKETMTTTENPFSFYENNIGQISGFIAEQIDHMINESSEEMVLAALKVTVLNNAKNLKYTQTVLNNWTKDNITTLEQLEASNNRKENGHAKNRSQVTRQYDDGVNF